MLGNLNPEAGPTPRTERVSSQRAARREARASERDETRDGASAGDAPLVSAAQRRQERNARQPSEASDLDRARRADESTTDPIDDARDASSDPAADVTDAAGAPGAAMDDPSRRTPSPAESAADAADERPAADAALPAD